jgi:hypothetical protein
MNIKNRCTPGDPLEIWQQSPDTIPDLVPQGWWLFIEDLLRFFIRYLHIYALKWEHCPHTELHHVRTWWLFFNFRSTWSRHFQHFQWVLYCHYSLLHVCQSGISGLIVISWYSIDWYRCLGVVLAQTGTYIFNNQDVWMLRILVRLNMSVV